METHALSFACDTDHDRHGIVTRSTGLLPPNHYLAVAIFYLFQHRPKWRAETAVGMTVVSSQMIDRVTAKLGRKLYTESFRGADHLRRVFDASLWKFRIAASKSHPEDRAGQP